MIIFECPVCGFNPNIEDETPSNQELLHQRLRTEFSRNASKSWWLGQARYVCAWLCEQGVNPESILDVGCGDGRWVPGILKHFPKTKYTGIDLIDDHIELNRARMPEVEWICEDALKLQEKYYDLIIIGGTLNARTTYEYQDLFLRKVLSLKSRYVVVQFDHKAVGIKHEEWFSGLKLIGVLEIPRHLQDHNQDVRIWLYENTDNRRNG